MYIQNLIKWFHESLVRKLKVTLLTYKSSTPVGESKCSKCGKLQTKENYCKNGAGGRRKDCNTCRRKKHQSDYKGNKPYYDARDANKRAYRSAASPNWRPRKIEDEIFGAMRKHCRALEKQTGIKHHVDHIIPLMGKKICGFHEVRNWQILTAKENLSKSNKWEGNQDVY